MADRWMVGDLATLDDYIPTPPLNIPSWADKAKAEYQRDAEAFQRGGVGEIARAEEQSWAAWRRRTTIDEPKSKNGNTTKN